MKKTFEQLSRLLETILFLIAAIGSFLIIVSSSSLTGKAMGSGEVIVYYGAATELPHSQQASR